MCKKSAYLVWFVLGLGLILTSAGHAADPGLVGWWKFDETSGAIAYDASNNGRNGALKDNPTWAAGKVGGAIQLDGDGDYVEVGRVGISGASPRTVAGWMKAGTTAIPGWTTVFGFAPDGNTDGTYFDIEVDTAGNYVVHIQGWQAIICAVDTQWHHVAATYSGSGGNWYLDGRLMGSETGAIGTIDQVRIGARLSNSHYFPGLVDDVRIYNRALTPAEIKKLVAGPRAYDPDPADGAVYNDTWVSLGWLPGEGAVWHNVYFGDNFDDVHAGAAEAFRGSQTTTYFVVGLPGYPFPDGLVPGTTYYWRIGEVEADGMTEHRGDVWSFWIPSRTAYNPSPADGAEFVATDVALTWTAGFGAKLHHVYLGTNQADVEAGTPGTYKGPAGLARFVPGNLESEKVYYWRIDEFDGAAMHKGEVWAFTTPGAAGAPQPANRATGVQMIAKLSWTPATTAASHQVYFGTDKEAVRDATTASPEFKGNKALGSETYDPGKLAWHTAYHWRVDAVYDTGTMKGLVWTFTTADFLLVDDFESYNDIDPPDPAGNRIFDKWIDGFGTTTNGSLVGNEFPPYAERTIVHGGAQSMPCSYDNNLKTSEVTMTLDYPRDWTEEGVGQLSLWFRGAPANAAERMYVALNGSAVVYHADAKVTQAAAWTEWVIDPRAFQGVNLTNVNTITIGFGTKNSPAAGGSGKMYFDDIRLYRPRSVP